MELECSPLRTLKNNRCEPLFSQIRNIVYELTMRVYPGKGWNDDLSSIHGPLFSALDERLQKLLSALDLFSNVPEFDTYSYYHYYDNYDVPPPLAICSKSIFQVRNLICSNDSCYEETFFEVDLKFHVKDSHDIDDIIQLTADLEADSLDILVNVTVYKFEVQKRDLSRRVYSLNLGDCSASTEIVKISKQNTCPMVSISFDDNDCFENMNGVICSTINMTLNVSEYHFGTDASNLFVCSDTYVNHFAHFKQEQKHIISLLNASVLLSLVCIIISLICLAVSFMTFCLFPRLRTLPGKNNMSLIMTLIIAQVMFLISSFGQQKSGTVGCI